LLKRLWRKRRCVKAACDEHALAYEEGGTERVKAILSVFEKALYTIGFLCAAFCIFTWLQRKDSSLERMLEERKP